LFPHLSLTVTCTRTRPRLASPPPCPVPLSTPPRPLRRCAADLGLISRRVASGSYTSLEHYLADVQLLFRNCRAFNRADTEYVACANRLEAFLRARISQGLFLAAPAPGAGAGAGTAGGRGVSAADSS